MREKANTSQGRREIVEQRNRRPASARDLERFDVRVTRALADIDYFLREPLGWREGTAVVWAGLRGAVTVAAPQTLPDDTPQRSVLVLIAYAVAAMSLPCLEGEPSRERFEKTRRHRLTVIAAQRSALLDARYKGTFDADVLAHAPASLDASKMAIEMRGGAAG